MMNTFRLAVGLAFAGATLSAPGAATAQSVCPNGGEVAVVRLSKLKPEGTMAGFEKAVAAHARWYASHGFKENRLIAAPVVIFDRKAGKNVVAKDQVLTIHYNAQNVPQDRRDTAWNAYVALYKANSEIVQETTACLTRPRVMAAR